MRRSVRLALLLTAASVLAPLHAEAGPWSLLYAESNPTAPAVPPASASASDDAAAPPAATASTEPAHAVTPQAVAEPPKPSARPDPIADAAQAPAAPTPGSPPPASVASTDPQGGGIAADFTQLANEPALPHSWPRGKAADPQIARLQILLDRANVSPGVIDGRSGRNLEKAVAALQNMYGLPSTGRLGSDIDRLLAPFGTTAVFVPYVITAEDVAGPFVPSIPKDYGEMAKLDRLAYRGPTEELAERFHMDEAFLKRLNPSEDFNQPGTVILVADPGPNAKAKVAHLVADQKERQLIGYDADWNVVVAYPATIGSTDMPSPSGRHAVKAIAIDPVYWYRPQVNFKQGNNTKPLKLAPGPNNPVGAVWIGLDKPTYGIHGTPEPSKIDKTNSHGCLRLTNWDAAELAHLVKPGVDVEFVDPTPTASVTPAVPSAVADAAPAAMRPMPQ